MMLRNFRMSESQPHGGLQRAHLIGRERKAELGAVDGGDPTCEDGVIKQICGFYAGVEIEASAGTERAVHGCVEAELCGATNGVAPGGSPLARARRGVSACVEMRGRGGCVDG